MIWRNFEIILSTSYFLNIIPYGLSKVAIVLLFPYRKHKPMHILVTTSHDMSYDEFIVTLTYILM